MEPGNRCQIVGPIAGIDPDRSWQQFHFVETVLRREGWKKIGNPRKHRLSEEGVTAPPDDPIYKQLMHDCASAILKSEAVFVMEGWENSGGASFEVLLAVKTGVPLYVFDSMGFHRPMRPTEAMVHIL